MKRKKLTVKRKTITAVKPKQLKTVTGGHGGGGGGGDRGGGGDHGGGSDRQGQDGGGSRYCPRW